MKERAILLTRGTFGRRLPSLLHDRFNEFEQSIGVPGNHEGLERTDHDAVGAITFQVELSAAGKGFDCVVPLAQFSITLAQSVVIVGVGLR